MAVLLFRGELMAEKKKGFVGWDQPPTDSSAHNVMDFLVQQAIKLISTATLVRVEKVTTQGQLGPVGFVDVTPLINMIDADGNTSAHGQLHGIPFLRLQGGNDKAIILDPKAGDVGLAVFADRDISSVKKSRAPSPPGSFRRFDMSDGLYLGGFLANIAPKSYIQFMDDGTIIVGNGQSSPDNPFECVIGKNFVQIKQKGKPSLHVTVDTSGVILGTAAVIAPDPFPQY